MGGPEDFRTAGVRLGGKSHFPPGGSRRLSGDECIAIHVDRSRVAAVNSSAANLHRKSPLFLRGENADGDREKNRRMVAVRHTPSIGIICPGA